jgi:hypothetical protein
VLRGAILLAAGKGEGQEKRTAQVDGRPSAAEHATRGPEAREREETLRPRFRLVHRSRHETLRREPHQSNGPRS